MTLHAGIRRAAGPAALASLMTAALLIAVLWVQRERHGWPFDRAPEQAAAVAGQAPATGDMAGMDMSGGTNGNPPSRVAIDVTADTRQTLGVQVQPVTREALTETIQAVATVAPDESRISHVHTRVAGWVEHLDVNTTGETVRAGQPVARVFSQELLSSQTEYLAARQAVAASGISSAVVAGGRTRLSVLGMTPDEITATIRKVMGSIGKFEHASLQINFGTIDVREALKSMHLFSREVMPEFADAAPVARAGALAK